VNDPVLVSRAPLLEFLIPHITTIRQLW
jgi:hypothetical protein